MRYNREYSVHKKTIYIKNYRVFVVV